MFRVAAIQSLATLQFFFLLIAGVLHLCGCDISMLIVLAPLELLLGCALLFWLVLGAVAVKLS